MRAWTQRVVLLPFLLLAVPSTAHAGTCEKPAGRLVSLQGTVEARGPEQGAWRAAQLNESFCHGDAIRTGARSRAALVLTNETIVRLDQLTTLTLSGLDNTATSWLDLLTGAAHFLSRTPRALKIKTPYVNAGVEGTEFVVRADQNEGSISVLEGRVRAENPQGVVVLNSGESAVARAGQAPVTRLVAQPRDAVQWSLYFPPLFDTAAISGPASWMETAQRSFTAYLAGDSAAAFAAIAAVSGNVTDARFFNFRAGLLLSVGRVDEAQADIARALSADAENAHAQALQSVVALARNDKQAALELARQANARDPQSAPAWIALSYAQQAAFNLEGARTSVEQALVHNPDSVLILARLSELWLSLGDLTRALKTANRSIVLSPNIARTQTVLGFAYLTQIKIAQAKQAFEKAIALDSADPLPRLGLGLVLIRTGKLDAGRREIEIAAALDPNNALIRSYLGKAYYEEKRNHLAAVQFDMAKQLDPNDPTPWFYDAIRKQTENRPIEALNDLQKSIKLNDNRAVYRSRLLLDQDLAARSVSLARIYNDLGFKQRALVEGWTSLSADPSNYSAHRLLADSYAALPRHEIARASELFQAQMLQPLNLDPTQPQMAESNLAILEGVGPASTGFGEYNPLFTRNQLSVQANGVVGSRDTVGNDLVVSGLYDQVSATVSTFHYSTDGFRQNNDLHDDLKNAFVQVALTPTLNFQAEMRRKDRSRGDLDLNFDPSSFSTSERETVRQETSRVGLRWAVMPHSDLLLSWINARIDATTVRTDPGSPGVDNPRVEDGHQTELLYLFRSKYLNLAAGSGAYRSNTDDRTQFDWTPIFGVPCPVFPPVTCSERIVFTSTLQTAYVYTDILPTKALTLTVGASLDSVEVRALDRTEINPKFGLQWQMTEWARLRAAYFETVKRPLLVNQSLEPTQVAGFNQFFDDSSASSTRRGGIGLDVNLGAQVYGGVESSHRDVERPQFEADMVSFANRDEELHRTYINWVLGTHWALNAEYQFEKVRSTGLGPPRLDTSSVPVSIQYFSSHGYFVKFGATFVRQEVEPASGSSFDQTHERFAVLDAGIGYRFPKRSGAVSLEVRNLRDKQFLYQDLNYTSANPVPPRFVPERTIFGRLSLNF